MKTKIHVPTREYAFIEVEHDGTLEEAVEIHKELDVLYQQKSLLETLKDPDFNRLVDNALLEKPNNADDYADSNVLQKATLQVIKRAFKRIKS